MTDRGEKSRRLDVSNQVVLRVDRPEVEEFTLDPACTALVLVDLQRRFCVPGGGSYNERYAGVLPRNRELLSRARDAGVKVFFVRSVRQPDSVLFTAFGREPRLLAGSSEVEFAKGLEPLPSETVIEKNSHDPFARTEFDAVLTREDVQPGTWTIVVTGVSASVCVHSCVLGFANRHYRTLIPLDCTAAETEAQEALTYSLYASRAYSYLTHFTATSALTFCSSEG